MFSLAIGLLRWRTSRARVRRKAKKLVRLNDDAALFRALDLAREAEAAADWLQARFWHAVARETARILQRRAILASIMCPPRIVAEDPDIPRAPEAARSDLHRDPTSTNPVPHIRLVHPAPAGASTPDSHEALRRGARRGLRPSPYRR
jgi:hypothetical protein